MNATPPDSPNTNHPNAEPPGLPGWDANDPFDASDRMPITGFLDCLDALLRNPRRVMFQLGQGNGRAVILRLVGVAIVCALGYGVIVGLFSGGGQIFYAPVKIAAGLLLSALICLPSLYIFAALGGSRAGLADVLGLMAGLLALTSILLIGFAPVAWIFSASTESIVMMGGLHLAFWLVGSGFGLRFLHAGFKLTSLRGAEGISVWTVIFIAVALQMTTALRPILGASNTVLPTEKKFFLAHWAENLDDASGRGLGSVSRQ